MRSGPGSPRILSSERTPYLVRSNTWMEDQTWHSAYDDGAKSRLDG